MSGFFSRGQGGTIAEQIKQYNCYIATPSATTIPLVSSAEYGFTINEIDNLQTSSGSLTLDIKINGVAVTGLAGLSVTTTPQSPSATALNTVTAGQRVTMVITNNSSSAGLEFTLKATLT